MSRVDTANDWMVQIRTLVADLDWEGLEGGRDVVYKNPVLFDGLWDLYATSGHWSERAAVVTLVADLRSSRFLPMMRDFLQIPLRHAHGGEHVSLCQALRHVLADPRAFDQAWDDLGWARRRALEHAKSAFPTLELPQESARRSRFRVAMAQGQSRPTLYIHGAESWHDFGGLVTHLCAMEGLEAGAVVEGIDAQTFCFAFDGFDCLLMCDDAWGHEVQAVDGATTNQLKGLASALAWSLEFKIR